MRMPHISLFVILVLVAGYAMGRYFPSIGQKVGLP